MMNSFEELNKSICRLCLRFEDCKKMVSLIDYTNENGISCYAEGLSKLTKVVIQKQDSMPKFMCLNCLHLLKQAVYFKLQCEHTDKCLKNIAHGYSENKDIEQAIAEFAMMNFYMDYKYSFSSTVKENNKCRDNKSNIQNGSDYNIEEHIQHKTDIPINNNAQLHSDSDVAQDDHSIKDSEIADSKIFNVPIIENNSKYIIIQPLLKLRNTEPELIIPEDNNLFNVLEEMYVPKAYDVPINQVIQKHETLKSLSDSSKTQADDCIKKMEEMFGTNSGCVESSNGVKSPKFTRRLKRRAKKQKNLVCNICEKVLANQYTYKYHMQRHNGCRYICEHCGKGFPIMKELQTHLLFRHGIGPYLKCSQCAFKAQYKLELVEHERIHSGERPFSCDKCGLTFRRRYIWRKHLIYHAEKKVQCPQCNKKFFLRSEMLAHFNNIHERIYVYVCSTCGATYAKSTSVRQHMTEQHGVPREEQGKIKRITKMTGYQERRKK